MKSTIFTKVLEETVLDVDVCLQDTVNRLRQLQGLCREKDGNQNCLEFRCNRKGVFRVDSVTRPGNRTRKEPRINYVTGKVVEENGATKVRMYCVHDRSVVFFRYFFAGIYCLLFVFGLWMLVASGVAFTAQSVLGVAVGVGLLIAYFYITRTEEQNQRDDFALMKEEVIHRVQAVDRWEE